MNTRITLTAVALVIMTLSGCSSLGGSTAPAAKAPAAPAAAAAQAPIILPPPPPPAPPLTAEAPAAPAGEYISIGNLGSDGATVATTTEAATVEATTVETTTAAADDVTADDAAMNSCFAAGGQVVNWVGDSSGTTLACRREDGLEYRLADAQYYQ